jgi:hypothetical protein
MRAPSPFLPPPINTINCCAEMPTIAKIDESSHIRHVMLATTTNLNEAAGNGFIASSDTNVPLIAFEVMPLVFFFLYI